MEEKQIINQLQNLKELKPNPNWVSLTKKEILSTKEGKNFEWLFQPMGRPALAVAFRGAMILMLMISGVYFYMYHLNVDSKKVPEIILSLTKTVDNSEEVIKSLENIKTDLDNINSSLVRLKSSNDLRQALAMTEVVKGTAERGGAVLQSIKDNNSSSDDILASIDNVEGTLKNLSEESKIMQSNMIERYIEDLEGTSLSIEDYKRFDEAKKYYEAGQETEAMILLVKIGENN